MRTKFTRGAVAFVGVLSLLLMLFSSTTGAAAAPRHLPEAVQPAPVAPPAVTTTPGPLPTKAGSVPRKAAVKPLPTPPKNSGRVVAAEAANATVPAAPRPVALRALVLTVDDQDWGLAPWTSTLDRVGASYDVVRVSQTNLTRSMLVDTDGVGRYNAVLLTSGALLQPVNGGYASGLDTTEWNTLWDYERDFGVRQATLYGSHGTWPEETCLVGVSEGGVGEPGITASLTARGAQVFDFLNQSAAVPIASSYVYRTQVKAGCEAQPVLRSGDSVLGVTKTTPDGREQIMLTFSSNQYLLQSHLLTFGIFRWASRGMFLGEQRHFLKLDVDDYFNSSDLMREDLTYDPAGFRMTGSDAINIRTQQNALRARHPLASQFRLTLAYNGEGVNTSTRASCAGGGQAALVAASLCIKNDVEWINHTFTHPKMNFTDLATSKTEITRNRTAATRLGLAQPNTVLKTGEYSGLGVFHPDVNNDIDPPTDYGLGASNPALIRAAAETGVKYLHGNMSFASHQPACYNCSIKHPLNPAVEVVPDWPTNIAYFSATPAQETAFYNMYYGPNGKFPYWPVNQTYQQILGHESTGALHRIAMGSMYTHTMHIPNLSNYGNGRTLAFDWLDAVMTKYESYYSVPLLSPSWATMAQTTSIRSAHFAVKDRVRAVWDPAAATVRVSTPAAGTLQVTGASSTTQTTYGSSVISTVTLTTAGAVLAARPLP